MTIRTLIGTLALSVAGIGTAFAAQQTVTLAVDNMTCSTCPYIVKNALDQVPGVAEATTSLEDKSVTVTFEDTEAGVADLTAAMTHAGYPSRLAAENAEKAQ